ncbi:MAG: hypothetical protein AB6733_13215 [Clostridiaceae bacterium]
MKKFTILAVMLISCFLGLRYAFYYGGLYIDFHPDKPVTAQMKIEDKTIYIKDQDKEYEAFLVKGVDLTSSIAGHYATDYAVDKETWLRWFSQIQEMGANTIRISTIYNDTFYNAFYEYNNLQEEPLYLLQGIQVSDYANNSGEDAYSKEFYETLKEDSMDAVDVVHGRKSISINKMKGSGDYRKDVSPWVIGYIVGSDWNAGTMAYTNNQGNHNTTYSGKYFSTAEDATAFEAMLAEIMDGMISYESKKYKTQRLISFFNDPQYDPFVYEEFYAEQLGKYNRLDAENIKTTDELKSGYFASYRLYEFCSGFSQYFSEDQKLELSTILKDLNQEIFYDGYTQLLAKYHSMPVIITGYGFSSARGTDDVNGPMTEEEQGQALVSTYKDIIKSGCSGAFVSTWQDTWERRTWNTSYAVNVTESYRWRDIQTNGQGYGLLSFDPGDEKSVSYVDGDASEWEKKDQVLNISGANLSARYDESFLYLMVEKEGLTEQSNIYIPIDTTPKSGSKESQNPQLTFERETDFLLNLTGRDSSKLLVQARYESLRENYLTQIAGIDPFVSFPEKDSPEFVPIRMICKNNKLMSENMNGDEIRTVHLFDTYETGKLVYGNSNPSSSDYNSLADFCYGPNIVEIRIPWQLLNFYNPADMEIHDDYYENYGVEGISISQLYLGVSEGKQDKPATMAPLKLKGWRDKVSYHQRLKLSYFILKESWGG